MAILSTITDQRLQLSSLIIGKKFNQRSTVGLCSLYCRILGKSAISHWKMFTKASMSFNDFYWLSNRFIKTVEARRKWKQYSRITRSGSLAFTAGQTLSLLEVDQRLRLEGSAEKYGLDSIGPILVRSILGQLFSGSQRPWLWSFQEHLLNIMGLRQL